MPDLLAVGETMLALTPVGDPPHAADRYRATTAGGESNVAVHVAAQGFHAAWASRLGDDTPGRRVLGELQARGVDTAHVVVDPDLPTGLMIKTPGPGGTDVRYYRAGSAASRMTPDLVGGDLLAATRVLHLTGVTPALSADCARTVDALVDAARAAGALVSVDVNHRPRLWAPGTAPAALAALARRADVCFVGLDEAEALWGTATPAAVRAFLPEPGTLVVKDGAVGATAWAAGSPAVSVPSPVVDVVEPVGAGDAFAGGFLSGLLAGATPEECLRRGHATAALVLTTTDDLPPQEGRTA